MDGDMDNRARDPFLDVTSEVGKLKAVLLHRPGRELEALTPDLLKDLLFDDIPWLKQMQVEHDGFAQILRDHGTEVYYAEDLLAEVLREKSVKESFVQKLLEDSRIQNPRLKDVLTEYLDSKTSAEVAEIAVAGLDKKDVPEGQLNNCLWDFIHKDYPLYINPIPNLYFMRDPSSVIGHGICLNSMFTETRRREPVLLGYIYNHHPLFKKEVSPQWFDYSMPYSIEGGDILVLSKEVIAIGCSERTSANAVEALARTLFARNASIREVLAIQIPRLRAFMHLDTVLTMVDRDKFTIYPGVQDRLRVYKLTRAADKGGIRVVPEEDLLSTLKRSLDLSSLLFIESGGGDAITAIREQWNDSTNTLAIAPGVVVTYSRNEKSNETLRSRGVEVIEIEGSELVRGRGGPRCMSCPLAREEL